MQHAILVLYLGLKPGYNINQLLGAHSIGRLAQVLISQLTLQLDLWAAPRLELKAHDLFAPHVTLILFEVARLLQEVVASAPSTGTVLGRWHLGAIAALTVLCGVQILEL